MIKTKNGPKNDPDELDFDSILKNLTVDSDLGVVSSIDASLCADNLIDAGPGRRSTSNVVPIVAQQRLDCHQLSTMPKEYRMQMESDIRKNIAYSIAEEMLRRGLIEFQEASVSPYGDVTIQGIAKVLEEPF